MIATALYLLSHIGVSTPFWETAIYMAVLGAGLGLTMQVLLIAAQNSVSYSELGVATSLATFSRSIGGSIGVAVFGTIFNSRLSLNLVKHVPAQALAKLHGTSVAANPAAVKHLPPAVRSGLQVAFSESLHVVFLAAVPFAFLAFLLALMLREVPLRTSMAPAAGEPEPHEGTRMGESLGMSPPQQKSETAHESLATDSVSPGPTGRGTPPAAG
jgi:hypothetical protein